jgi:hypothetical protein
MRYELYLESGPQHRKTWVYVPACPAARRWPPLPSEAPEAARAAIRRTPRLPAPPRRRPMPGSEPIEVVVAEHIIERKFLGFAQGSFPTDLLPMQPDDAARQLRWAEWSREELVAAARAQTRCHSPRSRPAGGRSAAAILSHVAGSEWSYVSSTLGTLPGGGAIIAAESRTRRRRRGMLSRPKGCPHGEAASDDAGRAVARRGAGRGQAAAQRAANAAGRCWSMSGSTLELRSRLSRRRESRSRHLWRRLRYLWRLEAAIGRASLRRPSTTRAISGSISSARSGQTIGGSLGHRVPIVNREFGWPGPIPRVRDWLKRAPR